MTNHWNSKMHMFTNGYDYVIAHTQEDARMFLAEHSYGLKPPFTPDQEEEIDADGWSQLHDSQPFSLVEENGTKTTKMASLWVEEAGEGFFASTEY